MVGLRESAALRSGAHPDGRPLDPREREALLKPYLPSSANQPSPARRPSQKGQRKKPMRQFLRQQLYLITYLTIQAIFSLYVRLRTAYHAVGDRLWALMYYHHRAPELIQKDTKHLSKLPQHLSIVLDFNDDEQRGAGLEGLVNDISEVAAWCASAGIPALSVYEKTGILKNYLPATHRAISQRLESYFGAEKKPTLSLRAPNLPSFSPPGTPPEPAAASSHDANGRAPLSHLTILLLSADDGRSTLVDLTKTLTEMSQRNKLAPSDISMELIDAEITESVMGEPDLLILFGPRVELKGYPPWQVRLTEIYHTPDTSSVSYQTFLRGLHKFAKAQMRFGR
ncbi:Di-trans-poly-cis-decaprenylcistransferase-like protein [Lasiodiplodia theobromae]|uniref:ditrans,polycis-polyprenyl diphosphate synthase [(2E,6E)-farnesyldiphosphate specific] n=2 Tax=Lasiodiplodia TaxID=66739 RepID=A0A5N5DIV4_9PEZI|nr:Di-trans-poly-cis-decaprenylcistransferase [Lasiodiplodia theobromae]KAB2577795.1 Dehydrodolichyl diphosphate synthase complex subunit NUS1 [Lasiodiplodia theobromae]KAF4537081.1 Di-trans-poly-cis-decaprenylcistransferase [Lasiodiplodia theobromae]KAF9633611.1 Di-trans-poly-cis-decaprenylcistransferase-like protein [Lasiodiplodia theobromae]KAK0660926.1 Dehydrodolichyl diphosphate synthase complex subunit NUS1 [Lasiodiplodia hormozganensis]